MDPPAGRRGRGLHLTPKGQAILKDAFPIWQDAQKRAFTVMGAESRNTLDSLLHQAEKLVAGLNRQFDLVDGSRDISNSAARALPAGRRGS